MCSGFDVTTVRKNPFSFLGKTKQKSLYQIVSTFSSSWLLVVSRCLANEIVTSAEENHGYESWGT